MMRKTRCAIKYIPTNAKSFIPYKASATVQSTKLSPVWTKSGWGIL